MIMALRGKPEHLYAGTSTRAGGLRSKGYQETQLNDENQKGTSPEKKKKEVVKGG